MANCIWGWTMTSLASVLRFVRQGGEGRCRFGKRKIACRLERPVVQMPGVWTGEKAAEKMPREDNGVQEKIRKLRERW
jgi:hypothetical protein